MKTQTPYRAPYFFAWDAFRQRKDLLCRLTYQVRSLAAVLSLLWWAAPGLLLAEAAGPTALFDGKSFAGWEGDTDQTWRIEKGVLTAGSLKKAAPRNEFLSTTREFENFDLQLKFKIRGNQHVNAGVQFRTRRILNHHEVSGYQADIGPGYDGHLYDESRRNRMLATPDEAVLKRAQAAAAVDGWQTYRIRAVGDSIQLWLNGVQTVNYTEQDASISRSGVIALQIHGQMQAIISYKDIVIEALPAATSASDDPFSPAAALESFTVADGLQVVTFAAEPEIVSISNIDVDHRGRVWACESVNYRGNNGKRPEGDRILILEDSDGNGVVDKTTVFYQGRDIDIPMGICVLGNKAIVSVAPDILLLEDTDGDDQADKKTVLLTSDADFQHDHSLHSFVFGPDGRFYANFGNTGHRLKNTDGRTIVDRAGNEIAEGGKPYHGGMVYRCDHNFENFEVLGHNFRNNYEVAVDSFGGVWQSDNDDDGNMGVRMNYILQGGNFGYLDELTGERWSKPRIGQHSERGMRHWHQNDPGTVPNVIVTGNGAPTGVAVYEGDLLPETFRNQVLFCDAGPHVVWGLPVRPNGAGYAAEQVDLIRSSDNNFRPVDVAVAPDGSLFVSDWFDPVVGGFEQRDIERGRIYWISPPGRNYSVPNYDLDTAASAAQALRSPNLCTRYLAWTRLCELGGRAEPSLAPLLVDPNPRIRARALWLLSQIPGRGEDAVSHAIADDSANVRIVGVRIADQTGGDVLGVIARLADDPAARVRAECAVLLRYHDSAEAARIWARLAAQHTAGDRWYLESLGIAADGKWDACLAALAELRSEMSYRASDEVFWRSRGAKTPEELARIVISADQHDNAERYIRAFDFQAGPQKDAALLSIAFTERVVGRIALEAMVRTGASKIEADERARRRLADLITANELHVTSLEAVKRYRLTELYPKLLRVAQQEEGDLRVDAIAALLDLQQEALVKSGLESEDEAVSLATGRVLAQSQHPRAMELLLPFLQNQALAALPRQVAGRALAGSDAGAKQLLHWLEGDALTGSEVRLAVASPLLTHHDSALRARAEKLFQLTPTKNAQALPKLSRLIEMEGDAAAGKQVFFKTGQCAKCHQAQGEGKAVGPDLSQIGTKLARSAIFETILYPSAAISHNFETYLVQLESGQSLAGVLVNENDQQIQLRDAEGILRTLDRAEVERLERSTVSLMPANLHEAITTQELLDLVDYLTTLKRPAK